MRRALVFLCASSALAASAQSVDFGTSLGPEAFGGRSAAVQKSTEVPLGLAFSLCLGTATWTRIGVSTVATSAELDGYAARGAYRLELALLARAAERSGKTLAFLFVRRGKGESLRGMAADLALDYEALYDAALADERCVREREKMLTVVSAIESPHPTGGRP